VRRFLAEFLSDRRVIELSPWLWKPILHGVILTTRPGKVVQAYEKIWMKDRNESPLRYYTRKQAEKLADSLNDECGDQLVVAWAMRYGSPTLDETLGQMKQQGCQRILVVPLYPQYSATSTATVSDKVFDSLKSWREQPALRTLPPYFDHPAYIQALASSIDDTLGAKQCKPEVIVVSYHGLPQESLEKGDPYYNQCVTTTRLLRDRLGVDQNYLRMTFQSRFGAKKWLQPATDHMLMEMAQQGVKHIAVITPGFAVDCLETLEEMGIRNRELFLQNGGERYELIPCLNDSKNGIALLERLVKQELGGWI